MSSIKALSGANPNKGLIVSLNTLIPAKITIKETKGVKKYGIIY